MSSLHFLSSHQGAPKNWLSLYSSPVHSSYSYNPKLWYAQLCNRLLIVFQSNNEILLRIGTVTIWHLAFIYSVVYQQNLKGNYFYNIEREIHLQNLGFLVELGLIKRLVEQILFYYRVRHSSVRIIKMIIKTLDYNTCTNWILQQR